MDDNGTVRPVGNGRLDGGRFAPGNRYGRGSPVAMRMYELRKALLDAADPDTVRRVARTMGEMGAAGDVQAARVYLDYMVGRPVQQVELSGPDGEPLGMDLARLQSDLLVALADHPEARVKVAMSIRALIDASTTERAGDDA